MFPGFFYYCFACMHVDSLCCYLFCLFLVIRTLNIKIQKFDDTKFWMIGFFTYLSCVWSKILWYGEVIWSIEYLCSVTWFLRKSWQWKMVLCFRVLWCLCFLKCFWWWGYSQRLCYINVSLDYASLDCYRICVFIFSENVCWRKKTMDLMLVFCKHWYSMILESRTQLHQHNQVFYLLSLESTFWM